MTRACRRSSPSGVRREPGEHAVADARSAGSRLRCSAAMTMRGGAPLLVPARPARPMGSPSVVDAVDGEHGRPRAGRPGGACACAGRRSGRRRPCPRSTRFSPIRSPPVMPKARAISRLPALPGARAIAATGPSRNRLSLLARVRQAGLRLVLLRLRPSAAIGRCRLGRSLRPCAWRSSCRRAAASAFAALRRWPPGGGFGLPAGPCRALRGACRSTACSRVTSSGARALLGRVALTLPWLT